MPEKQCACGTSMDSIHGVWRCHHCDDACEATGPCASCVKYSSTTNLRYNDNSRTEKPGPDKPADG